MTNSATSALVTYVTRYADAVQQLRYDDLRELQPPPYALISVGAAGTALALARLADAGRLDGGYRIAARWLDAALRDRTRVAVSAPDLRSRSPRSLVCGRAGLPFVGAYLSSDRSDAIRRGTVERYLRSARGAEYLDVIDGAAGHLLATCALLQRVSDDRLVRFRDELGAQLARRARARMRRPWRPEDTTGFAHRWPGILHALLTWRAAPAPWLVDGVVQLARLWRPDARADLAMRGTWCQGAAGSALLFAKAFEQTRERELLRAARQAARAALRYLPDAPHLCCGSAGVAYALLALDRIDPGRGWRAKADDVGVHAISVPNRTRWPNGLLWGYPGIVCLALDLLADRPRGFPLVEA